jgi:hypothetical protein
MSSNYKIILTTAQLLEAHATHGNDFILINFESTRKFKNFAQYIDIDVKLADGKVAPIRYWKLSNEGIQVGSRLRKPEDRKYESIRMGVGLKDEEDVENENVKALKLLCEAFEEKMKQLKNDNLITDNERDCRKQADGSYHPFHLISTKVVSPMQTTAKDKETDDIVDLENLFFWLSIPKKKFYRNGEVPHEAVHFEEKYYADEAGRPDETRPIMTHLYAPDFYNVDDFYHHRQTGKKIYKHLGAPDGQENYLDNTNIQDYLTKGSMLIGNLKFELAVSGRQCKLDVSLFGRFFVKKADAIMGSFEEDEDTIDAFADKFKKLTTSKPKKDEEDFDVEDFDEDN